MLISRCLRWPCGFGEGSAVELEQVVGPPKQLPPAVGSGLATAGEPSDAAAVFESTEDGLDEVLPLLIERGPGDGGHLAVHPVDQGRVGG